MFKMLNGNILKVLEYKYDPVGRRIIRLVTDNINPQKSNTKKYYYDGSNILAELDAENNLTASYTHSPLRPDDILGAKFTSYATPIGALSEGQVLAASSGNVYYLKDRLNTVNEITNATGDIVQKMEYSAFGVLRSVKDAAGGEVDFAAAPVRTSFAYTGREFEPELGMYYYRARYYDPNTGRFLQQDPDPGKLTSPITFLSKYIYTGNNPVMFGDPSGRNFLNDLGKFVGDLVGYAGLLIAGLVEVITGIITLDIAKILTGLVMIAEFALGWLNLLDGRPLPKLTIFKGTWAVENSWVANRSTSGSGGFSLGAGMFLNTQHNDSILENTKQHEYGHYLQYKEWGGWDYISTGWDRIINDVDCGFLERDADDRAGRVFPGFTPAYHCGE